MVIWDVEENQQIKIPGCVGDESRNLNDGPWFHTCACSPDGELVGWCDQSVVRVWNSRTNELVALSGHQSRELTSVAFSPDSSRIASCSKFGELFTWDVRARK